MRRISLIYSADWKGEEAKVFVEAAIKAGFRRVRTAPGNIVNKSVWSATGCARYTTVMSREKMFVCVQILIHTEHCAHFMQVQTRFTPRKEGNLFIKPYLRASPFKKRVKASVESSLSNLRYRVGENRNDAYVDCMLLHMP
jgi:hypothetical protein